MTDFEQQILDIIQDGFPITERPYAVIADLLNQSANGHPREFNERHPSEFNERHPRECGDLASLNLAPQSLPYHLERSDEIHEKSSISEQSVFDTVEHLRDTGIIRRMGGVYDSRKLGFVSRLCAGIVPASELDFSEPRYGREPTALEKFAAAVDAIPAITHNYVRSHHYNVWFTVIAENEEFVQKIVDKLRKETDIYNVYILASKRMFKINTVMGSRALNDGVSPISKKATNTAEPLTEQDKVRINLLSGDLPHSLTPFADMSRKCGCSSQAFLDGVRDDLATRRMRRLGAVLRHQAAGFAHNAMVCFNVAGAELGGALAANPHVSHCYERAPFEGFPYNLYAMFHAGSAEELDNAIASAAQSLMAIPQQSRPVEKIDYVVLHSVRELKKTSFTFFAD